MSLPKIFEHLSASEESSFLLLFDFSMAFYKIKRSVLLKNLASIIIPRNILLLIKENLTGRTQNVNVDGYQSEKRLVSCKDPQGSVLGPTHILIYINDKPNVVVLSLAVLFANELKFNQCTKNESLDNLQLT